MMGASVGSGRPVILIHWNPNPNRNTLLMSMPIFWRANLSMKILFSSIQFSVSLLLRTVLYMYHYSCVHSEEGMSHVMHDMTCQTFLLFQAKIRACMLLCRAASLCETYSLRLFLAHPGIITAV